MGSKIQRARRFATGSAIYAGSVMMQFVTVIIVARALGPVDFGRYSIYSALSLIFIEILAFGSGDVLIKHVALEPGKFQSFLGHSLTIGAAGLLPCSMALTFIALEYQLTTAAVCAVLLVFSIEIGFGRIAALGEQAFIAHKQSSEANSLKLVVNGIRMLAALIIGYFGLSLNFFQWAVIQAAASTVAGLLVAIIVVTKLGWPHLRILHDHILSGLLFSGTQIVRLTQLQVDRLTIGIVASAHTVGIYSAASRVVGLGTVPMVTLLRMTYPYFFERGAKGIAHALSLGLQVLGGLLSIATVTFVIFFFSAPFLPVLLGEEYTGAVTTAQQLAPIAFTFAFQYAGGDLLSGAGYQLLRFVSTVLNLVFITAGILFLGHADGPGAVVAAVMLGNAVGAAMTWIFVLLVYLRSSPPHLQGEPEP